LLPIFLLFVLHSLSMYLSMSCPKLRGNAILSSNGSSWKITHFELDDGPFQMCCWSKKS
jgi:hypothetical protein